jgi:hypothetical protein
MTHEDLELLWPEGPAFTYRAAIDRLQSYDPAVVCPAKLPEAQMCWDLRLAVQGVLRITALEIEAVRKVSRVSPESWLMTSRAINGLCRVVLEGVR